jgi:indole-3-glycerol phosphate synthase
VGLISEIKFASPSAGQIRDHTDPIQIGRLYEEAGAAAISFLTEKTFFQGDIGQLPRLKKMVSIPVLRKDFILDEIQISESYQYGADAILLIVRILEMDQLERLYTCAKGLGLAVLMEIHDKDDLEKALWCDAEIIGINNRDLNTFHVDLNTTRKLAPLVPEDKILVCESGIRHSGDVASLKGLGVHAVLVGSTLMMSDDPGEKAKELILAGEG